MRGGNPCTTVYLVEGGIQMDLLDMGAMIARFDEPVKP